VGFLLNRRIAGEWLMAVSGYNTVTSFFDESGKFKDHNIIAFGGVASYNENSEVTESRTKEGLKK